MTTQLTARDLDVMKWMNGLGFVKVDAVMQRYGLSRPRAYDRLKKLTQGGYLVHERIFFGEHGIYRVSDLGVQACGDRLPALRKVTLANYHHDLKVAELSVLLEEHCAGVFIPERRLRHEWGLNPIGQTTHVSDGLLKMNHKTIAIEIELSSKGQKRRRKIIQHYLKQIDIDEVWYFCDAQVVQEVKRSIEEAPFIKVHRLADGLNALAHLLLDEKINEPIRLVTA